MDLMQIAMEPNLRSLDEQERDHMRRMLAVLPEKEIQEGHALMRQNLLECWHGGDMEGVFCYLGNGPALCFVFDNLHLLKERGLYETALLLAYRGAKVNLSRWSPDIIRWMFIEADPAALRSCGGPVPDEDPVTLYRGVAGNGRQRRVSGLSWTTSIGVAAWFARRFGLPDPAVFTITVPNSKILVAIKDRSENECIVLPPFPKKPVRLKPERWVGETWKPNGSKPADTAA